VPAPYSRPMQVDWGTGHYEHTAAQLEEPARVAVEAARLAPGDDVVDIGCGTGNAALLAAAEGACVTGVDPAGRLLGVAHERAAVQGLDVTFLPGDAAHLPLAAAAADAAISVFGVVFAPDPAAAAAEIGRVLRPEARLVLTAWIPAGAVFEVNRFAFQMVARVMGTPPGPPPFPWHDLGPLASLLGPHGFDITLREHRIAFSAESARAYLESEGDNHPFAVAARALVEARGMSRAELFNPMLSILESTNEDPAAFRITSRYVVATARRGSP
jgi:SAM-dependent methyltransferase